jgi:4-hydroxy-3-methylbut-2-enyl diphosphate reductase
VRHEIVHNRYVVDAEGQGRDLCRRTGRGARWRARHLLAHGVPKSIPAQAARGLDWLDATCPLVSKVHRQAERQIEAGRHIIFIGHKGHPEVIGTLGQVPEARSRWSKRRGCERAALHHRGCAGFPDPDHAVGGRYAEIVARCAAIPTSTARAPKTSAMPPRTVRRRSRRSPRCEMLLVIGAPNSSNSMRLVEVAERRARPRGWCSARPRSIPPGWTGFPRWASPPGPARPKNWCAKWWTIAQLRPVEETLVTTEESMIFKLPRQLAD